MPETTSYAGRTLVVLLCMHRSGSSLVANLLERLGMSLGPFELMGATEHNKYGHFEAVPFYDLDRTLLADLFGFSYDVPETAESFRRFSECEGLWSFDTLPRTEERVAQGRQLIAQLVASGEVSGFKDPRVPLLWPYWSRVLAGFPGLRVVPVVLLRSPHEIAMSIFTRGKGAVAYRDALEVTAVHYRRMRHVIEGWSGESAVVRFDSDLFTDDLRRLADACHLTWNEELFTQVYDASCRHHEPAPVVHRAEALFRQLGGQSADGGSPATLARLETDAATREDVFCQRLAKLGQELWQLRTQAEQAQQQVAAYAQQQTELQRRIAQLEEEITAIRNSRTWRWHDRVVRVPPVKWLLDLQSKVSQPRLGTKPHRKSL
jgi:hypothetical protein